MMMIMTMISLSNSSSFVAHATVTDADSGDNGRFNCSLSGLGASSRFTLRRLYATEFVILTVPGSSLDAVQPESDGGGPDTPGRRTLGLVLVGRLRTRNLEELEPCFYSRTGSEKTGLWCWRKSGPWLRKEWALAVTERMDHKHRTLMLAEGLDRCGR